MDYFIWTIIGYLSGSVLYGYLIPKYMVGVDVVALSPDHNPGTYNAFMYGGKKVGYITVICEVMKGFLPVFISSFFLDKTKLIYAFVIVAPAIGHCYSIFNHFKGGKAIGISYGIFLGLLPHWVPLVSLMCLYLFFSKVVVINPHFFRTIVVYGAVCLASYYMMYSKVVFLGAVFVSLVVISKHIRKDIKLQPKITFPLFNKDK